MAIGIVSVVDDPVLLVSQKSPHKFGVAKPGDDAPAGEHDPNPQ